MLFHCHFAVRVAGFNGAAFRSTSCIILAGTLLAVLYAQELLVEIANASLW